MFRRLPLIMLAVASATFLGSAASLAASEIVVMADEAKLISVAGEVSTVVVGNPSIADATIQGSNVFIHGRSFGSTNLIVLDRQGSQIANLDVTVMQGGNQQPHGFSRRRQILICMRATMPGRAADRRQGRFLRCRERRDHQKDRTCHGLDEVRLTPREVKTA